MGETFIGPPLAADSDGDARDDLLLTGYSEEPTSSLSFFGRDGQVQANVRLPAASSASARDVTSDDLPDFILSGETMLGVKVMAFQSKATRRPTPLIGATRELEAHARLFMADLTCSGGRELLLLETRQLSRFNAGGELVAAVTTNISTAELDALEAQVPFGSLDAIGSFAPSVTSGCDLLALPNADGTAIDLYGSRNATSVELITSVQTTSKPRRLFFADENQDGAADLYVVGEQQMELAYGVGDGRFHSDPSTLPKPGMGVADGRTSLSFDVGVILIMDGEGTPRRILGGGDVLDEEATEPIELSDAFALELTGDGLKDVARVGRSRTLYVERSHPSGHASPVTLRTPGIPKLFGAADFDGDGHDDLLLAESANLGAPANSASVLFAPMTPETTSTTELAEVEGIRQLLGGYLPWLDINSNAAMSVLYTGEDGSLKLGFLSSGADRLLRSEVRPPTQDISGQAGMLGSFSEPGVTELAVITSANDFGVASASPFSIALHTIGPNGTRFERSVPIDLELTLTFAGAVAADRDGDGQDELYAVTPGGVSMLRIDGETVTAETVANARLPTGVRAQDVNDDGSADVVVFDGVKNTVSVLMAGESGFGKTYELTLAPSGCTAFLNAATFVQLDQDGERELVVNCGVAQDIDNVDIFNTPLSGNITTFDVDWSTGEVAFSSVLFSSSALHLTTADFNGDGVDDVAGDGFDAQVLMGTPRQ